MTMDVNRVNSKVFQFCFNQASSKCKNWQYRVCEIFKKHNLDVYSTMNNNVCKKRMVDDIKKKMFEQFHYNWNETINRDTARYGNGGNKLRTYKTFKNEFKTEHYVKIILPSKHRSAFSKFRAGVAPLRIETGRFERLPEQQRLCPFCVDSIENEMHVYMRCPMYHDIRLEVFDRALQIDTLFHSKTEVEQFTFLFSCEQVTRSVAKSCYNILQRRRHLLIDN